MTTYAVGDIRYFSEVQTLTGVTQGTSINVNGSIVHSAQFVCSGMVATTTAQAVLGIDGSLDRDSATSWFSMSTSTITADGTYLVSANESIQHIRANVTSVNTGAASFLSEVKMQGAH